MTDFIYDKHITDSNELGKLCIDVTVVDIHSDIMLTLKTGRMYLPIFLSHATAMELARLLTNAVCAYDDAVAKAE